MRKTRKRSTPSRKSRVRRQNIWKATQPIIIEQLFRPFVTNLITQGTKGRRAIRVAMEEAFEATISEVTFNKIMKELGLTASRVESRFELPPVPGGVSTVPVTRRSQMGRTVARLTDKTLVDPAVTAAEAVFDSPDQVPPQGVTFEGETGGPRPASPAAGGSAVLDPSLLMEGPREPLPPAISAAIAQNAQNARANRRRPAPQANADADVFGLVE